MKWLSGSQRLAIPDLNVCIQAKDTQLATPAASVLTAKLQIHLLLLHSDRTVGSLPAPPPSTSTPVLAGAATTTVPGPSGANWRWLRAD